MAYELTVECLVVEALLRDPSIDPDWYRAGLKRASTLEEQTRERVAAVFKSPGVSDYAKGYLAMAAVLAMAGAIIDHEREQPHGLHTS